MLVNFGRNERSLIFLNIFTSFIHEMCNKFFSPFKMNKN